MEFEALLSALKPTEGLFNLAFAMFRDLWDAKLAGQHLQGGELKKELALIERKVDALLDRIVDADGDSIVKAYEKRIRDLETQKAVMRDRIENCGRPLASFSETYRTAFDFLASPCELWRSDKIEDRRAVLKLVFSQRLTYVRGEGYRTAQISMPFKLLGGMKMDQKTVVRAAGVEPALLAEPDFESGASTNSTTPAAVLGSSGRNMSSRGRAVNRARAAAR